jgi:hypothetical protein
LSAHPSPITTAQQAAADAAESVLYAVLDDIRNTLGMAWLDPAFRGVAAEPTFLTAAWAATRPNITKSFTASATRLRKTALESLHGAISPPDHRREMERELPVEEMDRLVRTVRALFHGAPKVYLVVQSWARLARRQRLPGTGREEVPAKRGVPGWQEGVIVPGAAAVEAQTALARFTNELRLPAAPPALVALSPALNYLERACRDIVRSSGTEKWNAALISLRREANEGLKMFPHPMELQWEALATRGLSEHKREALADELTRLAAVMPVNVLITAYLCRGAGGADGLADA